MADVRQLRDGKDANPFGLRHRTAREAVLDSQRGRMLEAMVKAVAEKGYAATTIADVVARAAVSRRTFYEQFSDKEECFIAAFDTGLSFLFSRIEQEIATRAPTDWQDRVRIRFETYLATLTSEPEFARVIHIDALAAGERARARWDELLQGLVALYRSLNEAARSENPAIPEVSDDELLLLVGGIPEVVRQYLRAGRLAQLPELAPTLTALAVAILSGAGHVRATADRDPRERAAKR